MNEITIKNLTTDDVKKLKEWFSSGTTQQSSEWSFPAGESKVTVKVEGPSHRKESEILQYAIDVLEVAKKHSTD